MSNFLNKYPYTDFHELNLDWVIERVKKLTEDWLATLEEWNDTEEQWHQLYDYVHDYFNNLDVQEEINNKLDAMAADGTLAAIISKFAFGYVTPEVYGCVGDGLTDDSDNFQRLLDSETFIWIPANKTYYITKTLNVTRNYTIISGGKLNSISQNNFTIIPENFTGSVLFNISAQGVSISNIGFSSSTATGAIDCIKVNTGDNNGDGRFVSNRFINFNYALVYYGRNLFFAQNSIKGINGIQMNCNAEAPTETDIFMLPPNNLRGINIINNVTQAFRSGTPYLVYFKYCNVTTDNIWTNVLISDNNCVSRNGLLYAESHVILLDVNITNNVVTQANNVDYVIYASKITGGNITGNILEGIMDVDEMNAYNPMITSYTNTPPISVIYIGTFDDVIIANNILKYSSSYLIRCINGGKIDIKNNVLTHTDNDINITAGYVNIEDNISDGLLNIGNTSILEGKIIWTSSYAVTRQAALNIETNLPISNYYSKTFNGNLSTINGYNTANTREDSHAYGVNNMITVNGYVYVCTTAGTSAASAPTYDTTLGNTTTDGTAKFKCVSALSTPLI